MYTPETYHTLTIEQKKTIKIDSVIDMLIDELGDHPDNFTILEFIWNEEEDTLGITMEDIKNHVR